jgi:hypothetical protein
MGTLDKAVMAVTFGATAYVGAHIAHCIERHYAATNAAWQHHGPLEEKMAYIIGGAIGAGVVAIWYHALRNDKKVP